MVSPKLLSSIAFGTESHTNVWNYFFKRSLLKFDSEININKTLSQVSLLASGLLATAVSDT
jgi:hypothetical protein